MENLQKINAVSLLEIDLFFFIHVDCFGVSCWVLEI